VEQPHFPPAAKIPTVRTFHGDTFVDDYEWLRDASSPRTKDFIAAQNRIAAHRLGRLRPLSDALFDEMSHRIRQSDMSVPVRMDDWWYFARTVEGEQYGLQCRVPVTGPDYWTPPTVTGAPGSMPGEQIYMDANAESRGHDFFALGTLDVSHDGTLLLIGADTTGDERYDLWLRRIPADVARPGSALDLPDRIEGTGGGACLTPDARWVFYPRLDAAHRPFQIWRHKVGTPTGDDALVYEEKDGRFFIGVGLSFDEKWIVISSSSKTTSEILRLPADDPTGTFEPVIARRDGVDYDVAFARLGDQDGTDDDETGFPVAFVIHDSRDENYEIDVVDLTASPLPLSIGEGRVIARGSIPAEDPHTRVGLRIDGIEIYRRFIVLGYRRGGVSRLAVCTKQEATDAFRAGRPWPFRDVVPGKGLGGPADLEPVDRSGAQEPAHLAGAEASHGVLGDLRTQIDGPVWSIDSVGMPSYDEPHLRYAYGSWTQPSQLHDLDTATGADRLLKRQEVLGDFDQRDYRERLVRVRARDGAWVPVSLVWRPGAPGMGEGGPERPAPLFVIGYGAYGSSSDPGFSVPRLSLLDRGVLYATVHVRGGGELGRRWYEDGKKLHKKNTFTDFIDAVSALQHHGLADPARTVAEGGSAGGLLMGAVANMAPTLFHAIEADVPFVDALTSILRPDLPLTVTEWDEWGDPLHDADVYRYMRSYSPYENVQTAAQRERHWGTRAFPHIFATTSLSDTRVLPVEPLKWIARLQEPAVGADAFVRVEQEGGHAGASGRYTAWHRLCEENAWCLEQMGIHA
jgi:oligopeptidase B